MALPLPSLYTLLFTIGASRADFQLLVGQSVGKGKQDPLMTNSATAHLMSHLKNTSKIKELTIFSDGASSTYHARKVHEKGTNWSNAAEGLPLFNSKHKFSLCKINIFNEWTLLPFPVKRSWRPPQSLGNLEFPSKVRIFLRAKMEKILLTASGQTKRQFALSYKDEYSRLKNIQIFVRIRIFVYGRIFGDLPNIRPFYRIFILN